RWSSLKRRTWSSSSRRRVPANRSANAFMSGASGAIRTTRAPDDARTRVKRAPSFALRSQTNTAGTASRVAFRACCAHHSSLGAYVTAAWMIVRRPREEEHEDLAEPDVVGLHEVARPRDVIPQEGRPALSVASGSRAAHVPLDSSFADPDAELEQLAADALGAPARIAGGYLADQRRPRRRRSPQWPRASSPEHAEACPVPAEDGRRLDEKRGVAPRRRQACGEPHREALPRCPADPPRDLALRHDELL